MAQRYSHNAWYDQTVSGVDPARGAQPAAPAEEHPFRRLPEVPRPEAPLPEKKRGKAHPGLKIASLAVCVLLLITASVYAFRDRGADGAGTKPADPVASAVPSLDPGEFSDDFRSFFEEYYSLPGKEEKREGSLMDRKKGDPRACLELVSAEGLPELSLQELYQRGIVSIIGVKAGTKESRSSYVWGTGVIITEDGYFLTNQHLVEDASYATAVMPDGKEYDAQLIGEDIQTDLAVLKINLNGLTPAQFGDSRALCVGDHVAAIGNPLSDQLLGTLTDGIISSVDRDISINGRQMTLLQTNTAINEGNSGGPLYNMYGQVIGITNMKMVNYYSPTPVEGIGFAIPSSVIKTVTDQLILHGAVTGRPALGLTLGPIPDDAREHYELPGGLYVYEVSQGGDALEKGIKEGDIVTHVNGLEVSTTDEVLQMRNGLGVGDTMTLTIWRDGKTWDVEIVLRDQNLIK